MLPWRGGDRSPASRGARIGDRDLGEAAAVDLVAFLLRADDVERVVLQHAEPNAVAGRRATVLAVAIIVDGRGGAGEAAAVEVTIDDRCDPPARDRVLPELEQAGAHRPVTRSRVPAR